MPAKYLVMLHATICIDFMQQAAKQMEMALALAAISWSFPYASGSAMATSRAHTNI